MDRRRIDKIARSWSAPRRAARVNTLFTCAGPVSVVGNKTGAIRVDGNFEQQVRLRAYEIWMTNGRAGPAQDHWFAAERDLKAKSETPCAMTLETQPVKAKPVKAKTVKAKAEKPPAEKAKTAKADTAKTKTAKVATAKTASPKTIMTASASQTPKSKTPRTRAKKTNADTVPHFDA